MTAILSISIKLIYVKCNHNDFSVLFTRRSYDNTHAVIISRKLLAVPRIFLLASQLLSHPSARSL